MHRSNFAPHKKEKRLKALEQVKTSKPGANNSGPNARTETQRQSEIARLEELTK